MPAKLDPEKLKPRVEGNVKIFDESDDRLGRPVTIRTNGEQFIRIAGTTREGQHVEYAVHDGVFAMSDSSGTLIKRGDYDGDHIERVGIGAPYGEMAAVSMMRVHGKPTGNEIDPEYHGATETMRSMKERLQHMRQTLGLTAGERCIEVVSRPAKSERFNPAHALNLRFLDADLHLTSYENFKPIVESSQQLPMPPELIAYHRKQQRYTNDMPSAVQTTTNTKDRLKYVDTRSRMVGAVHYFLSHDTRGKNVCATMDIEPGELNNLAPHEVIELIGHILYETTNYDFDALNGGNLADDLDALEILERGLAKKSKKEVKPLGVCRNFASVGEELFYAFKEHNGRLKNTYCFAGIGYGGAVDATVSQGFRGHAWMDFVMVAGDGQLVATTVDPTWTSKGVDGKLNQYDQIDRRIGTHIRTITSANQANYDTKKNYNSIVVENHFQTVINEQMKKVKRDYADASGRTRLAEVPNDDPRLQKAVFSALELKTFADTVGGGYRFRFNQADNNGSIDVLVARAADYKDEHYTNVEMLMIVDSVCNRAEKPRNDDERQRMLGRIEMLEAMAKRDGSLRGIATSMNEGLNAGRIYRFGLLSRLSDLVDDSKTENLRRILKIKE